MHANSPQRSVVAHSLLIDEKTVVALVLLSGRTLKRRIKEGRFPAPIVIGRMKRWPRAAIENWIATEAARASEGV
jgi:predicted DNA-binding transcriptional regulator AlpA